MKLYSFLFPPVHYIFIQGFSFLKIKGKKRKMITERHKTGFEIVAYLSVDRLSYVLNGNLSEIFRIVNGRITSTDLEYPEFDVYQHKEQ